MDQCKNQNILHGTARENRSYGPPTQRTVQDSLVLDITNACRFRISVQNRTRITPCSYCTGAKFELSETDCTTDALVRAGKACTDPSTQIPTRAERAERAERASQSKFPYLNTAQYSYTDCTDRSFPPYAQSTTVQTSVRSKLPSVTLPVYILPQ